jgi:TAP-like protein
VPTLVLAGDLDSAVPSERARAVAAQFPHAQFVEVANGGHVVAGHNDCTLGLVTEFLDSARRVDSGCASAFTPTYAVHTFARQAELAPAPPVDPAGGDSSQRLDRRVAGMAWAAAYDGIQRVFRMSGDSGVGLRGGMLSVEGSDTGFAVVYDGARFSEDVAVSGRAEVDFAAGGQVVADLLVDGPGGRDGSLHVAGTLFPHTETVSGRGTIGGRRVAVLLPTA